jgi:hypothetical membrane protein
VSVLSSAIAPVLLIGGWTVAAGRQAGGFDAVSRSISALAATDAGDRWIMTTSLAGVGVCHLVTASGLRASAAPGRAVLAVGGVSTLLVAAFPLGPGGSPAMHTAVAAAAFGALAVWPAASWSRSGTGPWALRAAPWPLRAGGGLGASALLLGLVGWFGTQLGGGANMGTAERWAAGAQAVWPFVVTVTVTASRLAGRGPKGGVRHVSR